MKTNSSIESQLKYIYRLQLIHLRLKYLNYIINRFTVFIIRFLLFLKQKKRYLFFLTQRLKNKKKLLRSNSKLNIYKKKIIQLLKLLPKQKKLLPKQKKLLPKQKLKLKKLEMDIEYNYINFLLKKRRNLNKKNNLIINSIKIKQIKKYIRIKELRFKSKIINYKQKKEKINKKIIFLKEIEKKIKKKINNNLLKRYKQIISISGIAVVPVYKKIPFGTYILITQQKYYELLERKKIIIEEISGRILIDFYLANKENNNMKKILFNFY
ncbi:Zinc ribbon protein [Candidatus Karelsulcia muelleri]|uniref:hypothetical protein n=1 Tax=Candidatus Karelsulcia muelleri TaxID=336810 RepID=UPI001FF59667|nr:hypothetical protein [Candidatus Karelsulcia muelleri]UOQ27695.1 Zinc ribbon protein [Candidatus Karelsulcia muelleri]